MKLSIAKLSTLSVAILLATGCVSTGQTTQKPHNQNAKDALKQTVKSQLRSSFGYETTVYPSNQIRRDELAGATLQGDTCESVHDANYIKLLKTVKDNDLGVADLTMEHHAVKKDYLACVESRVGVSDYQPYDFEAFYESAKHLNADALSAALQADINAHTAALATDDDADDSPAYTELDVKKSTLINEYLIKPSKTSVVGSYQPLKGVFTALPTASYDSKNLAMSVNQPIYVDLKAGVIYLWADNLALINSQTGDKTLGDKWQHKWLAIPLNDGSLPKDFVKDFAKAYAHAKQESLDALDDKSVQWVNADSVLSLPYFSENIDDATKQLISQSSAIIQKSPNDKMRAYSRYIFNDTLYNDITAKYPELIIEPSYPEYTIVSDESNINISTINMADEADDDTPKFGSQRLMSRLLMLIKYRVDSYYAMLQDSQDEPQGENASPYAPVSHYGIQAGGIGWLHERRYFERVPTLSRLNTNPKTPAFVDIITIITPDAKQAFNRLPTDARTPNESNSINLYDYQNEWLERMKSDANTYQKIIMQLGE